MCGRISSSCSSTAFPRRRTAAFHEPYVADSSHGCCFRGSTTLTVPDLVRWIARSEKLGLGCQDPLRRRRRGDAGARRHRRGPQLQWADPLAPSYRPCQLHSPGRRQALRRTRGRRRSVADHLVSDGDPRSPQGGAWRRTGTTFLAEPRPDAGGRADGSRFGLAGDPQSRSLERHRGLGNPPEPVGRISWRVAVGRANGRSRHRGRDLYDQRRARRRPRRHHRLDRSREIGRHHRARSELVRDPGATISPTPRCHRPISRVGRSTNGAETWRLHTPRSPLPSSPAFSAAARRRC